MSKNNESIYLDKLEFDQKLNKGWEAFFIDRTRFTWLVIFVIIIAGFLGLKSLPLESSPEIDIGMALISTSLPGASPESIEDLVTKKIEKEISKVKDIDTITSISMNSVSLLSVQFKSDADIDASMRELKDKVDLAKVDLPSDANDSIVKEVSFDDTPIWTFSISGNYDSFKLYEFAKIIRDELEKDSLVSEVNISGGQETEYGVFIDPKKLEAYNLTLDQVNSAIKSINFTLPIGDLNVGEYTHSISVDSRYYDVEKLKNIVIQKLGDTGLIHLNDIALIEETPKKIKTISRLSIAGGESLSAVTLGVVKKRGGSIVNLVSNGDKTLKDLQLKGVLPDDLNIKTIVDQSERIKLDLAHLIRDGLITVFLVFITLFLVIGIKEALVAGAAVPLVFLITFIVMSIEGQTLNFLSMFALILSLGLLVDDAIVVISAINQYKKTGKFTTRESALLVLRDYKKVLITTTLTVVWIFSAMLFMTGIIGKFIFSIPFVITITLLSSLIIALTINPALAVILSGRDSKYNEDKQTESFLKKAFNRGFISLRGLENKYGNIIRSLISNNKKLKSFLLFTFILFLSALYLPYSGLLKSDFFPKTDGDIFFINIEAEPGLNIETTSEITRKIEGYLLDENWIDSFSTEIGKLASTGKNMGASSSAYNYSSITVNLIKKEYGRLESSIDIVERIRKTLKNVKDVKITILEEASGPPSGADFEIKIAGEDFVVLDKITYDVKNILSKIPGTINIDTSRKPLPFEFSLFLDSSKLSLYDINIPQVSLFLKNVIDGVEATKIYKGTDEIVVRTKYDSEYIDDFDKIKDLTIKNNRGQSISLRDLIKQDFKPSVFSIMRIDQERIVSVTAAAKKGYTGNDIKTIFDNQIKNYKLATGYKFITGGANEENQKSVQSLMISLLFGMVFIIATLVLLYDSFRQSVLVMVTIPLSLIGVFYGLVLFGQPLSFPGLIGLVALFGIVVRNGIILFDKINLNLRENIEFKESIINAGVSRLEPVFLTSVCTILGMIPLTLSNPTWTSLGLSIIFGLAASTFFTLLVLPSLFYIVFKKKYSKNIL